MIAAGLLSLGMLAVFRVGAESRHAAPRSLFAAAHVSHVPAFVGKDCSSSSGRARVEGFRNCVLQATRMSCAYVFTPSHSVLLSLWPKRA